MDIYLARQPIFDRKMKVLGYELLYRSSMENSYQGIDDNHATAQVINNTFLSMHFEDITSGTKAFINFSHDMIIKEIPLLLPKDEVVIELVERAEINEDLIKACRKLSEQGYTIALDDFYYNERFLPLLELAHIVKIEFSGMDIIKQKMLMDTYKGKLKFLAEKIETRFEYQMALNMGYDYFQGYFFSKPVIIKSQEVDTININIVRILEVINDEEDLDYQELADIIETDIGLSYKLLKLVNSAFFSLVNKITSLKQALVHLGISEIRKWLYILLLKDIQVIDNKELINISLIRAKIMELLAVEIGQKKAKSEYFLAGMFSSIDVLMNRDMKSIMDDLPLSKEVKGALLGENNDIKRMLNTVISSEKLELTENALSKIDSKLTVDLYTDKYLEALAWVNSLAY